jgi:peptide/nickel transport system substrate-binding protein
MKNKTIVLTSIALMLLMLMTSTIIISPVKAEVKNPYEYISLTIGDPMDADPVFQYDQASLEMLFNVYEPLVFFNFTSTNTYEGIIADSWHGELCDVTDTKTGLNYKQKWIFHIRPGVHFHTSEYIDNFETGHISDSGINVPGEGAEVTPADVEYSFERNMVTDASTGGECLIWDPLLHVGVANTNATEDPLFGRKIDFAVQSEIDGPGTVTFYLLTPFEPFLQCVAQMYGAIMSKAWVKDSTLHLDSWDGVWPDWNLPNGTGNQNYARWINYHDPLKSPLYYYGNTNAIPYGSDTTHPHIDYMLGTGPYIFDYWDKGTQYRLTRNPHYWKGWSSPAHADNFVSKTIAAWTTRRDVFIAGDGDTCVVPNQYKSQVEGIAGINCLKDLSQLTVNPACFFNQWISPLSTYCGTMPANGTFTSAGFPSNGFKDIKLRKAFRALFPYDTWLAAAYLGEAKQPASCVCEGLAYYDPSIPKPVTDINLAIKLLKEAWGGTVAVPGPVWQNGFLMDFCYNSGNEPRKMACEMFRDAFESLNSAYGTHFTGVVTEILWTDYSAKWKTRVLPFYFVGWGADFPDAHNFVVPFMESVSGAFAKFQGFTNETINTWIREGIDSIDPAFRQDRYTKLQQAFVDNCYSVAMAQPLGRHWIRDWAQGFYYHSCMAGEEYAYYRWKEDPATVTRGVSGTVDYASGSGLKRVQVSITNTGVNPELYDVNETITIDGVPTKIQWNVWVLAGHTYRDNFARSYTGTTVTISVTIRITTKWIHLIGSVVGATTITWKVGDLGRGPPPTFFAFDGVIDAFDYTLWKQCYDGLAPANALGLGDLGTGPPPTFFAFDGVIDAFDYTLWKQCYDGLGPN